MQRVLNAFAAVLCFSIFILADEPPSWREFSIKSENEEYVAKVTIKDKKGSAGRWEKTSHRCGGRKNLELRVAVKVK